LLTGFFAMTVRAREIATHRERIQLSDRTDLSVHGD
jgi:hypothetical protein